MGCHITVAYDAAHSNPEDIAGADEVMQLPDLSSHGFARHIGLFDWVYRNSVGTSMIMHGDMFPMRNITFDDLLRGKEVACTSPVTDRIRPATRWAVMTDVGRRQYDARTITWPREICEIHPWDFSPQNRFPEMLDAGYDPEWQMEWCSPGLLHLNRMTSDDRNDKLCFLERLFPQVPPRERAQEQHSHPCISYNSTEFKRRKGICRNCDNRPDGCWKNFDFECPRRRAEAMFDALTSGECPMHLWDITLD